ncbi:cysteine peptidase family C39 domain-containing protein [Bosea sp. FBZP-16]|uniref:C39 family peptidase n=1 Tax=Bosea sp. FBZP-16 TaxID=2065382 RepID=UPI001319FC34|nr:cysteine peptidase family C39 domain-containing protein [Bosea sp. FBZP-16]
MLRPAPTRRRFMGYGVALSASLASGLPARAEETPAQESSVRRPKSFLERRFDGVVGQTADFTCGAASVATILTYYWNRPTTEIEVLEIIRSRYTAEQWKNREGNGVSFDDLIFAAKKLGFQAAGAEIALEDLPKLAAPVILHLDKGKFQHFSVLRRAVSEVYYMADSIVGQTVLTLPDLRSQYTGKALAIAKRKADLPTGAALSAVRDGTSVSRLVGDVMLRGSELLPPALR